jgi:hypothetical protein
MYYLSILFFLYYILVINADTECPVVSTFNDKRINKNKLRLVQYNVEWLFIDYNVNADCPGKGCSWHTNDDAKTHLTYVSHVIKELNPDIINFCEIQGCNELHMLQQQKK